MPTKAELEQELTRQVLDNHRLREQIAVAIKFIPDENLIKYTRASAVVNEAWRNAIKF